MSTVITSFTEDVRSKRDTIEWNGLGCGEDGEWFEL